MYRISNQVKGYMDVGNINLVVDFKTWQIIHIDESLLQLLQNPASLNSEYLRSLIHEEDMEILIHAYQQLQQGFLVGTIRFRVIINSKSEWIGMTPFLYDNGQETLLLANTLLIGAEVENLQVALKFANKKNSILQMLSHDLRGQLAIAKSIVSILNKDQLSAESLAKTQVISDIITQTIALIEDLVDKEFLETAEAPLVKHRVNLVKKLQEYIDQCKRFERVNERTFTLTSSSDQILIDLDESKFMQVVNNLINNALKFTRPDGHIRITLEDHTDHVFIAFEDDGIGIPDQLLPFIFDRYTIAKRSGLQGEPTTGLGLFIVREIIRWHGGEIQCESREGQGTTFNIKLAKDSLSNISTSLIQQ